MVREICRFFGGDSYASVVIAVCQGLRVAAEAATLAVVTEVQEKGRTMQLFLETDRLLMRRFTGADLDNLFELDSDPEVMRFLNGGEPTSREFIQHDFLPRLLSYYERVAGFGTWAAIERSSGAFLGWFSFRPRQESRTEEVELGYRLRKSAWGKGYATEGASALIRNGFTELGVQRVIANTYEHNIASRRVMEKAGLTLARAYRLTTADLPAQGSYQIASADPWDGDDVEYALTKADWERSEPGGASSP